MGHKLNVQVLDSDGDPKEGVLVRLVIDGFWKGGAIEDFTDDDGQVDLESSEDYEDSREIRIWVCEQMFGPYRIDSGAYTVQLE